MRVCMYVCYSALAPHKDKVRAQRWARPGGDSEAAPLLDPICHLMCCHLMCYCNLTAAAHGRTATRAQAALHCTLASLRLDNCLPRAAHPVALATPVTRSWWGPPLLCDPPPVGHCPPALSARATLCLGVPGGAVCVEGAGVAAAAVAVNVDEGQARALVAHAMDLRAQMEREQARMGQARHEGGGGVVEQGGGEQGAVGWRGGALPVAAAGAVRGVEEGLQHGGPAVSGDPRVCAPSPPAWLASTTAEGGAGAAARAAAAPGGGSGPAPSPARIEGWVAGQPDVSLLTGACAVWARGAAAHAAARC